MRHFPAVLTIAFLSVFCSPIAATELSSISNAEATGGLKEALIQGAGKAVGKLGAVDGFMGNPQVKIPAAGYPEEGGKKPCVCLAWASRQTNWC